jgi:hypothetical protein
VLLSRAAADTFEYDYTSELYLAICNFVALQMENAAGLFSTEIPSAALPG